MMLGAGFWISRTSADAQGGADVMLMMLGVGFAIAASSAGDARVGLAIS